MANETPPPPPAVPQTVPRTPTVAIWSLVLAILSFFCGWLLTAIPAVICGHVARSKIRKSGGALRGEGIANAGLISGYIALVLGVMSIPVTRQHDPITSLASAWLSTPGNDGDHFQSRTQKHSNPAGKNRTLFRCLPRAFEAY